MSPIIVEYYTKMNTLVRDNITNVSTNTIETVLVFTVDAAIFQLQGLQAKKHCFLVFTAVSLFLLVSSVKSVDIGSPASSKC